jgi:hypothetical protein
MQAAGAHSSLDRPLRETEAEELSPRHHPVLALGKRSNRLLPIASPRWGSNIGFVRGLGGHPLTLTGAGSHLVRGLGRFSVGIGTQL